MMAGAWGKSCCIGFIILISFSPSLFDTSNERYDKLRRSVQHFIIMQIGICTFRFVQDKNKYEASRYTFYIFPKSFASVDNKFMCQASSLEFLCQHDFDFNKVRKVVHSEKTISWLYWNYFNLPAEYFLFFWCNKWLKVLPCYFCWNKWLIILAC